MHIEHIYWLDVQNSLKNNSTLSRKHFLSLYALEESETKMSYCQKWCLSNFNQAAIRISGITSIPSENCIPSITFAR